MKTLSKKQLLKQGQEAGKGLAWYVIIMYGVFFVGALQLALL